MQEVRNCINLHPRVSRSSFISRFLLLLRSGTRTALGDVVSQRAVVSWTKWSRHPCPPVLPQGNPNQSRNRLSPGCAVCQGDSRFLTGGTLNLQLGSPGHGAMERVTRFVRLLHSALKPSIRSPHCQYWTRVSRTVNWPSGKGPVVVQSIPMRSVGCGPNEPLSYVQVSFPSISNAIAHW